MYFPWIFFNGQRYLAGEESLFQGPNFFSQNSASQPAPGLVERKFLEDLPPPTSRPQKKNPSFLGEVAGQKGEGTWSTLPETNSCLPLKIPIFPGKYHHNGGFSMAMLVYRSVYEYVIIQLSPGKSRCQHITFKLPSQKLGRWGVPFQRWGSNFSLPGI